MTHLRLGLLTILACAVFYGCAPKQGPASSPIESDAKPVPSSDPAAEAPPVVLEAPVAFWKDGKAQRQVDAAKADEEGHLLLDLGEEWTPYILTEASSAEEQGQTSEYRSTYLALARGEFPKDRHGYRAEKDQYLELYGILPTLTLLRKRFTDVRALECAAELDLLPLQEFEGFLAYENGRRPARRLARYQLLKPQMAALVTRAQVESLVRSHARTRRRRRGVGEGRRVQDPRAGDRSDCRCASSARMRRLLHGPRRAHARPLRLAHSRSARRVRAQASRVRLGLHRRRHLGRSTDVATRHRAGSGDSRVDRARHARGRGHRRRQHVDFARRRTPHVQGRGRKRAADPEPRGGASRACRRSIRARDGRIYVRMARISGRDFRGASRCRSGTSSFLPTTRT